MTQLRGGGEFRKMTASFNFCKQTWGKKQEFFFPIFELSPLAYNAKKIAKVNGFNK